MYEVKVSDDWMFNGLDIYIGRRVGPNEIHVYHNNGDNLSSEWRSVGDGTEPVAPTIKIPEEAARALLDALVNHYQGSSDIRQSRQDLLHERGRVDNLIGVVTRIAERRTVE